MKYTARIILPVERGNFHSYIMNYNALNKMLEYLNKESNVISVEWENGDCVATVEILSAVELEPKYNSCELLARDIISQNNR